MRFNRATDAMAAGDMRTAVGLFIAIADDAPTSSLADDALFTAARLYEERLTDPVRAVELYRRLIREYPDSRTALAAQRRERAIVANIGIDDTGARALSQFTDILQHFTRRGETTSLSLAEQVLSEHPDWSGRIRVLSWIADVHRRAGRHTTALSFYLRAVDAADPRSPGDENLLEAYRGAGEAALELERFDDAERYFRAIPVVGDPSRVRSVEEALERLERQRTRSLLYKLSFGAFALALLALVGLLRSAVDDWRTVLRLLRRPPFEALFMLPIAGLLIAASMTAHYAIAPAVTIMCTGGLAITWLSGAGVLAARARNHRLGAWRSITHTVLSAIAVLSLTYIAIHHNRLIDMLLDTVRFGPDV